MKTVERFTPLYAIAYAILNSIENLRSDKEGYFYVLVIYRLFIKRNRKHFPRVPIQYCYEITYQKTRLISVRLASRLRPSCVRLTSRLRALASVLRLVCVRLASV